MILVINNHTESNLVQLERGLVPTFEVGRRESVFPGEDNTIEDSSWIRLYRIRSLPGPRG